MPGSEYRNGIMVPVDVIILIGLYRFGVGSFMARTSIREGYRAGGSTGSLCGCRFEIGGGTVLFPWAQLST